MKNNELYQDHLKFKSILKECERLRWKKLNDYGITYNAYGYVGLLVKLEDKYGRIKNLYNKQQKRSFESSRDSLVDLVNYAVMAIMELDKNENNKRKKCG